MSSSERQIVLMLSLRVGLADIYINAVFKLFPFQNWLCKMSMQSASKGKRKKKNMGIEDLFSVSHPWPAVKGKVVLILSLRVGLVDMYINAVS